MSLRQPVSGVAQTERPPVSGVAQTERPPPPEGEGRSDFRAGSWIGRVIDGRYRVLELLGEGGMGAVFLAEHVKLAKKVALKVILPQFAGNAEVAERFAREAMASARLDHPHVSSALDYGSLPEGGAYLVMQFVRGRSLRKALEQGEGGWRFACEVGAQIADALAAAHAERIVHRDLKPENVILEPRDDGTELVKVLDFGVARVVSDDVQGSGAGGGKALTRVGTIIGTPGYMAPEQALGEAVDARADLYALGALLWELTAKRPLFSDENLAAIVTAQLTTTPPRLSTIAPETPADFDELVARLLARNRDDRPARASEVRDALRRLLRGAPIEENVGPRAIAAFADSTGSTRAVEAVSVVAAAPTTHRTGADAPERVLRSPAGSGSTWPALPPTLQEAAARLGIKTDLGVLRSVPTSYALVGCFAPLLGGTLLFVAVLVLVLAGGGDPASPAAAVAPAETGGAPTAEPGRGGEPGALRRPDTARAEPARAPAPPPAPDPAAHAVPIPPEIASDVSTLLNDEHREDRRRSATRLRAAAPPDAPPFVAALVELELSDRCSERRTAVRRLAAIGDPRALPALERINRDRRGCGVFGTRDCHRCLRRDLRSALETLRAASRRGERAVGPTAAR